MGINNIYDYNDATELNLNQDLNLKIEMKMNLNLKFWCLSDTLERKNDERLLILFEIVSVYV